MEEILRKLIEEVFRREMKKIKELISATNRTGTIHENDYMLSKKNAAEMLDCSEALIDKWVRTGALTKYQMNGQNSVRFRKSELLGLMKDLSNTSDAAKIQIVSGRAGSVKRGRAFVSPE